MYMLYAGWLHGNTPTNLWYVVQQQGYFLHFEGVFHSLSLISYNMPYIS